MATRPVALTPDEAALILQYVSVIRGQLQQTREAALDRDHGGVLVKSCDQDLELLDQIAEAIVLSP